MGQVLQRLMDVFYTKKLDVVVIGLENRYVLHASSVENVRLLAYVYQYVYV